MLVKLKKMSCYLYLFVLFASASGESPNFLLLITDDQDLHLNGMLPMKETIKKVANQGVFFTNAFVHSPICCPSRSSLLTGKYLHNIKVYNNSLAGNCYGDLWRETSEPNSIAALLHKYKNYNNFYAGKYLNQYGEHENGENKVPKGYDWWFGLKGNSKYYNFTLHVNDTAHHYEDSYLTDLLGQFSKDFLRFRDTSRPFFMTLAVPAPHAPFTPAQRHRNAYADEKVVRNGSFNVTAAKKHWLLRMKPENLPANVSRLDDIQKRRLQTLLSVDDLVQDIIEELQSLNILDNTFIIFTSDNGYHLGQFSQPWDKRQPYQTDVCVPLMIRGPGVANKVVVDTPISLVDLAPTILHLAGLNATEEFLRFDGSSLVDLLQVKSNSNEINSKEDAYHILVEYFGEGDAKSVDPECGFDAESQKELSLCSLDSWCKCQDCKNNTYACLIRFNSMRNNERVKYCEFFNKDFQVNFVEVYDLNLDPFELNNVFDNFPKKSLQIYKQQLGKLLRCQGASCKLLKSAKF